MKNNFVRLALVSGLLAAGAVSAQQASLTVACGPMGVCNTTNTDWSLTKQADVASIYTPATATWTVEAAKAGTSSAVLGVSSSLTITNTGSAPATIGNIVANLQKKVSGNKFVTVASDVADATHSDDATEADVCSGASSEGLSHFKENAFSGPLNFTDAVNNTVWALNPAKTIAPGETVTLNYNAKFGVNLPAGSQVRVEMIVSFGNAGARGGSGASCNGLDINGDGSRENNVRSVPCRTTVTVPVVLNDNAAVTLSDTVEDITTEGSVEPDYASFFTNIGGDPAGSGEVLTEYARRNVSIGVNAGMGTITNVANLLGSVSYDSLGNACNAPVDRDASATITVMREVTDPPPPPPPVAGFCTYSQGGYGGRGAPYQLLASNFATAFPSGIEAGVLGDAGFSMKFTSAAAVQNYLPASATAGVLTADLTNPVTTSAGVFGGQVLTLKINVAESGVGTQAGFGGLYYCKSNDALYGKTVSEVLATMESVLGGGAVPDGHSVSSLNDLADSLNTQAFHECVVGGFAQYLRRSTCQ